MTMEFEQIWVLKIYTAEDVYYNDKPLFNAIIEEARRLEIAGATVFKCIEGYATEARGLERRPLIRFSEPSNLPIVLESIDKKDKLELLLPFLEKTRKQAWLRLKVVLDWLRIIYVRCVAQTK